MARIAGLLLAIVAFGSATVEAGPSVGAAPKGDAATVAARIIKENFPKCRKVSGAVRAADGAIRAKCDGASYLVFTMFNPNEGRTIEVAMNCTAAKELVGINC